LDLFGLIGATDLQPDGYYRAVNVLEDLIRCGELQATIASINERSALFRPLWH
jgi:hypothetical protein